MVVALPRSAGRQVAVSRCPAAVPQARQEPQHPSGYRQGQRQVQGYRLAAAQQTGLQPNRSWAVPVDG